MSSTQLNGRGWDVVPSFVSERFLGAEIFDEVQNHPLIAGDSSWGTRNLLHALILSTRPRMVVEIGAQIGAAALVVGAALRANGFGKSYHLEPQEQYYPVLRDFITRAGLDDFAYALQMRSTDPVLPALIDHGADLIFLDANHGYSDAYQDLTICDSLLSSNGLILVDDAGSDHSAKMCNEERGGVRRALISFVSARPEYSVIFLEPPFWLNPCGLAIVARTPFEVDPSATRELLAV
jgi:predicted O-methyltransferase YrrM